MPSIDARRLALAAAVATVAVLSVCTAGARADALYYRCGPNSDHRVAARNHPGPGGKPARQPRPFGFQPYLFVMDEFGMGRTSVARAVVDTGWLGGRLVRTDAAGASPFAFGVCRLASNTGFACERDVARDPAHDLFDPAFSPDGKLVAVVQAAPRANAATGSIVIYDTATAAVVRTVATGDDSQPTWSPDGKWVAFGRRGDIYLVRSTGGRARRAIKGGQQPTWVTAEACVVNPHPRVRVRGRSAIVSACAPRPGRVTVTLTRSGKRVERKSVKAATGGTLTVKLHRPAGTGALRARVKFRAATR